MPVDEDAVPNLEDMLTYSFRDRRWAEQALTHEGALNEPQGAGRLSNQALAFLGDAVLETVVREGLHERHAAASVGDMSQQADKLVDNARLSDLPIARSIAGLLIRSKGTKPEESAGMRAEAVEAVIGAVFLDGGYEAARQVTRAKFL